MNDVKKEVCRALTNVVRNSPLAEQIDPKSFFVMLNTNFSVLYQQDTLDLVPIWEALAADQAPPPLYGLFVAFEQTASERGFRVSQPPAVVALSPEQRASYHALVAHNGAEAPPSVVELSDDEFFQTDPNATALPLSLGTGDIAPYVPDELKRDIVQLVVQSLKAAPVGEKLDNAQLAYLVDSNFSELCDGTSFDFAPVLGGLRQLDGVQDSDVYAGVVLLEQGLAERDIELKPLHMDVDQALAPQLVQAAEEKARAEAERAAAEARARAREPIASPPKAPAPTPSEPAEPPRGHEKREQRLKSYGLRVLGEGQMKVLRYGVLMLALGTVLGLGWMYRGDRELDVARFQESGFPLARAELREGAFLATVDDSKWWPLPVRERKVRLERFEEIMRANGWVPNAQIRDGQDRLVVTAVGGGKLAVAPFFELGAADGSIPEDSKALFDSTPPEARAASGADGEVESKSRDAPKETEKTETP